VRDEKVLLLHRPKQADTATPAAAAATPSTDERVSSQG
jgi:hypothetical protein